MHFLCERALQKESVPLLCPARPEKGAVLAMGLETTVGEEVVTSVTAGAAGVVVRFRLSISTISWNGSGALMLLNPL